MSKIQAITQAIQALPLALQVDLPVTHYFGGGVYAREMGIPEGATVVGKVHKLQGIVSLSQGALKIHADGVTSLVIAPCTFVAPAGTQRVLYALKDTVLTTYHPNPTNTRDLTELESALIGE